LAAPKKDLGEEGLIPELPSFPEGEANKVQSALPGGGASALMLKLPVREVPSASMTCATKE
jgi:hypothetical protein